MKQYAEHGKVGICHSLKNDDLYVRVFYGGYPYLKNGVLVHSSKASPIYSYGKNYKKNDAGFAFFVWTTEADKSKIENLFESLLPKVTDNDISQILNQGSFTYIQS